MDALALQNAGPARNLGPSVLLEGKYRLERVLGAGAMGRVWLARNIRLDAPVAIKIVERESHGAEAMARALTEARLEARLRHPNIVRVLDCHADQDLAYVVMELLEGCTLAELMDEGPLPPSLAVRLLLPLIDGLSLAHRAGVVHRDIKPENIFVARTGERVCPKLLDFGIAHVAGDKSAARKKRLIVGTPGYMAPEQAFGERDIDARADIWSLGVVLYEAVSGESAFGAASYQDYLGALNGRVLPPLPEAHGGDALWRIVQRALCASSLGRHRSCSELADELRSWLRSRGVNEDLSGDSLPPSWVMSGSIVGRALARAAQRHSVFGERDSFAPTQVDMTTRRKEQRSSERQDLPTRSSRRTRATAASGARAVKRAPQRAATPASAQRTQISRASTIRTLPRAGAAPVRRGWSAYALAAGAVFGIGFALAELHGEARAAQQPHVVSPATPQPRAASAARPVLRAHARDTAAPATAVAEPEPETDAVAAPRASAPQKHVSARPRAQKARAADPLPLRKQASALGLKSPW